jgi:arginine-tRNA-protein transferase
VEGECGTFRIATGTPAMSAAGDLFDRFHRAQADTKGWPMPGGRPREHLRRQPVPDRGVDLFFGWRLVGVGYVDVLPQGLSAIYFVYDPEERHRSLVR